MEHLEHPPFKVWEKRRQWFENVETNSRGQGSYFVSDQACALTAEVQAAFCAGAWAGVIILVMAVVDAALRETEVPGFKGSTKRLIDTTGANLLLQYLSNFFY